LIAIGETSPARPSEGFARSAAAVGLNGRMNMHTIQPLSYTDHRFPAVTISHSRLALFFDLRSATERVGGMMASDEPIREWS
jgi:hypothetical protein